MKRIVLMMAVAGLASTAYAADLLDLYRDAQSNDSQFASAKAQYEANREKVPEARAALLPNIVFGGSTTDNHAQVSLPSERPADFNGNSYQVQLTQPLFRWQNWVAYEQGPAYRP